MEAAILFGVASAVLYGVTDFVARSANRAKGVLCTMLWGQGFIAAVLTVFFLTQKLPQGGTTDWIVLLLSNLAIVAGTGCLYYGLAGGRITVVAPIMACYGAVSALLAVATGEALTPLVAAGLAFAVGGAILSATSSDATATTGKSSGWFPAMGAALFYGVGFWMQGKYSIPAFGTFPVLWIYYLTATIAVAATCLVRKQRVIPCNLRDGGLILATATLAAGGYAALAAGQASDAIAIVTALSSASTAVTVVLAFLFSKDKPGLRGWLGVLGVAGGIALVHLGVG